MQNIANPKINFLKLTKIPPFLTTLKKKQAHTNPCRNKDQAETQKNSNFYVKFSRPVFSPTCFSLIFLALSRFCLGNFFRVTIGYK